MLPLTNATITINRLTQGAKTRTLQPVASGVRVYMNPAGEAVVSGFQSEGAWKVWKMMTDSNHVDILIGDRVVDQDSKEYEVKGAEKFNDITGKHNQYILLQQYD
jgi:hypothetical protein